MKSFTRKSFKAWLAKQPASRRFDYTACSNCLIATWIKDTTKHKEVRVLPDMARLGPNRIDFEFPKWLLHIDRHAVDLANASVDDIKFSFTVRDFRKAIRA